MRGERFVKQDCEKSLGGANWYTSESRGRPYGLPYVHSLSTSCTSKQYNTQASEDAGSGKQRMQILLGILWHQALRGANKIQILVQKGMNTKTFGFRRLFYPLFVITCSTSLVESCVDRPSLPDMANWFRLYVLTRPERSFSGVVESHGSKARFGFIKLRRNRSSEHHPLRRRIHGGWSFSIRIMEQ